MAYLGERQRSEAIRFLLTLDTAPTGTPTVTVTRGGTSVLTATNMVQGASTLEWYYDYTTGGSATVGAHEVKYIAVVDAVTRFAYDTYDQKVYDNDDIKAETASIQTDTASIENKTDIIDTNVDTSLVNQTNIEGKVDIVDTNVDTLLVAVAAVPTVGEIDTELTSTHGSGAWTAGGVGSGSYNATINVKDDSAVNVADAYVTIHNASDDDLPRVASGYTDASGNTTLNIDGNVYVRVKKTGFNFTSTAKNVTATATYNVTGTVLTISPPSDPDLCRLWLTPLTLSVEDITDLADNLFISSKNALTKVDGTFIHNTKDTFTYDSSTDPDTYYYDAVQGAEVHIACDILGIDNNITVPATSTSDLYDLIT